MPADRAEGAGAESLADLQPCRSHLELARSHGRSLRRVKQRRRFRRAERRAQRTSAGRDGDDTPQVGLHQRGGGDAELLEHRHERRLELGCGAQGQLRRLHL